MRTHIAAMLVLAVLGPGYLLFSAVYWRWAQCHVDTAWLRGTRTGHHIQALGYMDGWRETTARLARPGVRVLGLERDRECDADVIEKLNAAAAVARANGIGPAEVTRWFYDGSVPSSEGFRCRATDGRGWDVFRSRDGTWSARLSDAQ